LKNTDRDKFLVETDGPVKYSRCFKGLTSLSSSFLVSIVSCAANVLGMTYDETKDILKRNSESFLKRPI
jgi:TatD DNase family protein